MTHLPADELIAEDGHADDPCGPNRRLLISETGGLTQFGAFIEILAPGSRSSIKHWHSAEDEMIYVLEGSVTLIEDDREFTLAAGDAATFRAGVAVGHCLVNRSAAPARYFVVGTRAPIDTVTYPDHDRICMRDRFGPGDTWTDGSGQPARSPYVE